MGDAILATSLLNTLRHTFPEAHIDFVLNERIAPLFDGHPSVDRLITFSDSERHSVPTYIKKVWHVVHDTRYDVIIDMRSTVNTMLFALFSPKTEYRIGLRKPYTWPAFNHRVAQNKVGGSIIDHDLGFAAPLAMLRPIERVADFTLHISDTEYIDFGSYLRSQDLDPDRPLMVANVTAKLASKVWAEDRMVEVLRRFIAKYPSWQIVFNYAPGQEAENAHRIYTTLGCPPQVKIDVQARSPRQLVAMARYTTLFFGNEGGARHIMQAAGCPSLVVCAPENNKHTWLPQTQTEAQGISPADLATAAQLADMSRAEQYALITPDIVWQQLDNMTQRVGK